MSEDSSAGGRADQSVAGTKRKVAGSGGALLIALYKGAGAGPCVSSHTMSAYVLVQDK